MFRYGHIFISNIGSVTLEGGLGIQLEDLQFGGSSNYMGDVLMNYVATINQCLHWNLCYFQVRPLVCS